MKKFSINPIERFIIRNHKGIRIALYVIGLAAALTLIILYDSLPIWAVLAFAFAIAIPMTLVDLVAVFKFSKIIKTANNQLDLSATLDASDKMLSILKPVQLDYIGTAALCKATALYDMGEEEEAKKCSYAFLDKCDVKKPPYSQMTDHHVLLASMALNDYDFKEYEFRKSRMERCIADSSKSIQYFFKKNGIADALDLNCRLRSSESFDEALEAERLNQPEYKNGKPIPESKRSPLSFVSAYGALFEYSSRLGEQEKAHYYARKICRLANEQFKSYREAKEYLDNEDIAD